MPRTSSPSPKKARKVDTKVSSKTKTTKKRDASPKRSETPNKTSTKRSETPNKTPMKTPTKTPSRAASRGRPDKSEELNKEISELKKQVETLKKDIKKLSKENKEKEENLDFMFEIMEDPNKYAKEYKKEYGKDVRDILVPGWDKKETPVRTISPSRERSARFSNKRMSVSPRPSTARTRRHVGSAQLHGSSRPVWVDSD